ncbi:MAG: chromate transporter [Bacillota bacterium]|nr:chromate transporter [Bacillota bacterium]
MIWTLLREFITLGAVTFGGGMAMIPLMLDVVLRNGWLTEAQFTDLIAISQATPGPIAINMATFVGFMQLGILGAVLASVILVIPGFFVATAMGGLLKTYAENPRLKSTLLALRAAVLGMLVQALVYLGKRTFFVSGSVQILPVALYLGALILLRKTKWPLPVYIGLFAAIGIFVLR